MRVIVGLMGEYSAMTFPEDEVAAYKRYFEQEAEISLDEFLATPERDGKIELDSEKTGRKVTITRVGEKQER